MLDHGQRPEEDQNHTSGNGVLAVANCHCCVCFQVSAWCFQWTIDMAGILEAENTNNCWWKLEILLVSPRWSSTVRHVGLGQYHLPGETWRWPTRSGKQRSQPLTSSRRTSWGDRKKVSSFSWSSHGLRLSVSIWRSCLQTFIALINVALGHKMSWIILSWNQQDFKETYHYELVSNDAKDTWAKDMDGFKDRQEATIEQHLLLSIPTRCVGRLRRTSRSTFKEIFFYMQGWQKETRGCTTHVPSVQWEEQQLQIWSTLSFRESAGMEFGLLENPLLRESRRSRTMKWWKSSRTRLFQTPRCWSAGWLHQWVSSSALRRLWFWSGVWWLYFRKRWWNFRSWSLTRSSTTTPIGCRMQPPRLGWAGSSRSTCQFEEFWRVFSLGQNQCLHHTWPWIKHLWGFWFLVVWGNGLCLSWRTCEKWVPDKVTAQ